MSSRQQNTFILRQFRKSDDHRNAIDRILFGESFDDNRVLIYVHQMKLMKKWSQQKCDVFVWKSIFVVNKLDDCQKIE